RLYVHPGTSSWTVVARGGTHKVPDSGPVCVPARTGTATLRQVVAGASAESASASAPKKTLAAASTPETSKARVRRPGTRRKEHIVGFLAVDHEAGRRRRLDPST